jgi:hypothetical protein
VFEDRYRCDKHLDEGVIPVEDFVLRRLSAALKHGLSTQTEPGEW